MKNETCEGFSELLTVIGSSGNRMGHLQRGHFCFSFLSTVFCFVLSCVVREKEYETSELILYVSHKQLYESVNTCFLTSLRHTSYPHFTLLHFNSMSLVNSMLPLIDGWRVMTNFNYETMSTTCQMGCKLPVSLDFLSLCLGYVGLSIWRFCDSLDWLKTTVTYLTYYF